MRNIGSIRAAFAILAFGLPVLSIAGPADDARAAHDRGDYESAFRIWSELAEQGNAEAQSRLGAMYLDGQGTTQDNVAATDWFRRAADQGLAAGQCNLGIAYSYGRGVVKDELEAVRWYRKAAEQNLARCQNALGIAYRDGRGVAKDEVEAAAWFRRAAEQGNAAAQTNLALMYGYGRGIAKSDAEAVRWYRKAAEQGYALGQNNLGVMYRDGRGVPKDNAAALLWFGKAAEQNNLLAIKNLAAMNERSIKSGEAATSSPSSDRTRIVRGADVNVGRIALQLSDEGWERLGASRRGLPYEGDRSGDMPFETQHLLLTDKAGEFRAVATIGATRGVATGRFDWTTDCRSASNLYAVDGTGGRIGASDCLQVSGPIQMRHFLESQAPDLLADLTGHNVALPNAAYLVIVQKGVENGSFTFVRMMFAADFKLPMGPTGAVSLPAGISSEAVAWGLRLAEAVRTSTYSPSGTLLLPSVTRSIGPDAFTAADASPPQTPAFQRDPKRVSGGDLRYPVTAIRAGIERGRVVARFAVDEAGNVSDITIITADPPGHFDQGVIDWLKGSKYRALGKAYFAEIEATFELKNN